MPTQVSIDRLVVRERDQHQKLIMFLSRDQIEDLTDAKRKDRQIQWLMDNGVRFVLSSTGRPKVLQSEIERVMLGVPANKRQQPDFGRING